MLYKSTYYLVITVILADSGMPFTSMHVTV